MTAVTLRVASEAILTIQQVRDDARCACVTADDPADGVLQAIIDQVTDDLATVSGGAINGRRSVVARPCRHEDRCVPCGCCGLDSIPLGDLRPEVTQVKIDGDVIPSDQYWMHWNGISWVLSRKPGPTQVSPPRWPSTQHRWKADTEDGTFSITFTQGIHVDSHAITEAALEAVCDKVTALQRRETTLEGVTSITLGGATAQLDDDQLDRITNGEIGPATRYLLGVVAPDGRRTSEVWAPELLGGWDLNLEVAEA